VADTARADNAGIKVGHYSVADAAQDWLRVFTGSERSRETSGGNIRNYILPTLGRIAVEKITRKDVQGWLHAIADRPTIRNQGSNSKRLCDMSDGDTRRKRRESANRIFNNLKALLNHAYRNQYVSSKNAWETVAPIPGTSAPHRAPLGLEEALRVIDACEHDFGMMVKAALMRVADGPNCAI